LPIDQVNWLRTSLLVALVSLCHDLRAGSLVVIVKDAKGTPVSDAVVFALGKGSNAETARSQIVIDQRDKQFIPYVTALQVGTSVFFANTDNIRHHVYSFSPAKKFELPLYSGIPAKPILFDHVGFVTLGCNIHDWMIAYVAVLPTPCFQVTSDAGRALLKNLPAGEYTVDVWHPLLKGTPEKYSQQVTVAVRGTPELLFAVDLKPDFRIRRAPDLSSGDYR
jgi:plastocyanin